MCTWDNGALRGRSVCSGTEGTASKLVLFIEDKIDAQFTTAQPQLYQAARECAVKEGRAVWPSPFASPFLRPLPALSRS